MLAGAGPACAAALVGDVAEAEGVASLVFGQSVVALGSGVGVPGRDGGLDGWPPVLDGGGEAVDLEGSLLAAWV